MPRKLLARPYSDEEKAQIRSLIEAGHTVRQVAVKLHRTRQSVRACLHVMKLSVRKARAELKTQGAEQPPGST